MHAGSIAYSHDGDGPLALDASSLMPVLQAIIARLCASYVQSRPDEDVALRMTSVQLVLCFARDQRSVAARCPD